MDTNDSFVFNSYPDDLESLAAWLDERSHLHVSGPKLDRYSGDLSYRLNDSDEVTKAVILIPAHLHEKLHYREVAHIIQRILWTSN